MPPEIWFIAITLAETKDRFPNFIKKILAKDPQYVPCRAGKSYFLNHNYGKMIIY